MRFSRTKENESSHLCFILSEKEDQVPYLFNYSLTPFPIPNQSCLKVVLWHSCVEYDLRHELVTTVLQV